MNKQLIGFAGVYYTLWSVRVDKKYITDAYGNHHSAGFICYYTYYKNISVDLEKVKALYPNLTIDENLRGETSSFQSDRTEKPEGYFWFGKYNGRLINEIIKLDFNYCIWAAHSADFKTAGFIKSTVEYKEHLAAIQKAKDDVLNSLELLEVGGSYNVKFTRNGVNVDNNTNDDGTYNGEAWGDYNGVQVIIKCKCKYVGGIYPYYMPILNGKASRVKGKEITINPKSVSTEIFDNNFVSQLIEI